MINQLFACYKLKCPKTTFAHPLADQFGARAVTAKGAKLLCTPGWSLRDAL